MVSGATGVDAFLLVVAADDGVMPQTREHLDILRMLGVEQGVVALSKDRCGRRGDRGTGRPGGRGTARVQGHECSGGPCERRDRRGRGGAAAGARCAWPGIQRTGVAGDLARLPVDRSFVLKGIGVVVTGTLWSGEIRPGDVLHTTTRTAPAGARRTESRPPRRGRPRRRPYGPRPHGNRSLGDRSRRGPALLSRPSEPRPRRPRPPPGERETPRPRRPRALHHGTRSTNARVQAGGPRGDTNLDQCPRPPEARRAVRHAQGRPLRAALDGRDHCRRRHRARPFSDGPSPRPVMARSPRKRRRERGRPARPGPETRAKA